MINTIGKDAPRAFIGRDNMNAEHKRQNKLRARIIAKGYDLDNMSTHEKITLFHALKKKNP